MRAKRYFMSPLNFTNTSSALHVSPTLQVSEKLEIAWQTAKDNLTGLREKNYVNMEK